MTSLSVFEDNRLSSLNIDTSSTTHHFPALSSTMKAGAIGGFVAALISVPLDRIKMRLEIQKVLEGRDRGVVVYAWELARRIGVRGLYRGFAFSSAKDVIAYSLFFGIFEFSKNQGYHTLKDLHAVYRRMKQRILFWRPKPVQDAAGTRSTASQAHADFASTGRLYSLGREPGEPVLLRPVCILIAGALAALAHQAIEFPAERLKSLRIIKEGESEARYIIAQKIGTADTASKRPRISPRYEALLLRLINASPHIEPLLNRWNEHAARFGRFKIPDTIFKPEIGRQYLATYLEYMNLAAQAGGYRRMLYDGFVGTALRALPVTSVCFLVFEIMKPDNI